MNSSLDSLFDYAANSEATPQTAFDDLWRDLSEREESGADSVADRDSVWLECSGDLIDADLVRVVGVRKSAVGETLDFVCPQCQQRHESLRFR